MAGNSIIPKCFLLYLFFIYCKVDMAFDWLTKTAIYPLLFNLPCSIPEISAMPSNLKPLENEPNLASKQADSLLGDSDLACERAPSYLM